MNVECKVCTRGYYNVLGKLRALDSKQSVNSTEGDYWFSTMDSEFSVNIVCSVPWIVNVELSSA